MPFLTTTVTMIAAFYATLFTATARTLNAARRLDARFRVAAEARWTIRMPSLVVVSGPAVGGAAFIDGQVFVTMTEIVAPARPSGRVGVVATRPVVVPAAAPVPAAARIAAKQVTAPAPTYAATRTAELSSLSMQALRALLKPTGRKPADRTKAALVAECLAAKL